MLRFGTTLRAHRLALLALLGVTAIGRAHDIPGKATLLAYVQPTDTRVIVLLRAPLEALTEVQFPTRGPGFIDIANADAALVQAAQIYLLGSLRVFADGVELPAATLERVRVSLPGDKAFTDFTTAFKTLNGPRLPDDEQLYWKQAMLDVQLSVPLPPATKKIAIDPNWSRIAMETHTVLKYLANDGSERAFSFQGYPGRVELEPSFWFASVQFVQLGFWHILDGIDHLLFLLCLAIPARSVRALIPAITAFTVAHSITLISSALQLIPTATWFAPLIETLIAASVFYMACENMFGAHLQTRWLVVFAFGLVHGFGFSFILAERMQFAGEHLVSALLAFNVGVELGQLLVLMAVVPLLVVFFKHFPSEKAGVILLSVIAAHTAWHWLTERGQQLLAIPWTRPTLDTAFFAAAMRWGMLLIASGGALWLLHELFKRWTRPPALPQVARER